MMKNILLISIFLITLFSCSKTDEPVAKSNICDNLKTDTAGKDESAKIFMANAFTPNNDGLNDEIIPITKDISTITFEVYDDNKNRIFTTNQIGIGWKGKDTLQNHHKYYYTIQSTTVKNHQISLCGEFHNANCYSGNKSDLYFNDQITDEGFTNPTLEIIETCQ